jgi:hypothetical protein
MLSVHFLPSLWNSRPTDRKRPKPVHPKIVKAKIEKNKKDDANVPAQSVKTIRATGERESNYK